MVRRLLLPQLIVSVLITTALAQTSPLQFLSLNTTEGVSQVVLLDADDYSSGQISIPGGFPFGPTVSSSVYVGTNGYFSFMRSVTYCCPHAFPYSTYNYLVAPFWADIDTRIQGTVSYEVHNDGSSLLAQVNTYLTSYTGSVFSGNWMIAAEWQGVQQHSRTGPTQPENTFQGILVTDGSTSYAVFVYNCDQMSWGGGATIGYHAEGDFYQNHELTGSPVADEIACTNQPDSVWSNVVYQLAEAALAGPQVSIRTLPTVPPFQAATRINFACDIVSDLEVTYIWTAYCTSLGATIQVFSQNTSTPAGEYSIWITSTPDTCLDVVNCSATDSLGVTGEASYQIESDDITGVGLWGTSESLPNNGAFVADANGQISTISCHTASRDPLTSQWVGPLGTDITFDLTDPFAIDARSGAFPSFSSFELGAGQSLSSADQGIYSCVIPDENGVEHTLNIGLYPQEYSETIVISHVRRTSEQPLTITCATTGLPATELLWSKGGTILVDGVTYQISQSITDRSTSSYNNTLTIGGSTEDATGIYSISVSTEIHGPGTPTTGSNVETANLYFGIYKVGTVQSITCNVADANTTNWLYDDNQLVSTTAGASATLTFVTNDSIHHRDYTCRGYRNDLSYGEVRLSTIVYVPTSALSISLSVPGTAVIGEEYRLVCVASETVGGLLNRPSVQWLSEDGNPLSSSGAVTVGEPIAQASLISLSLTFDPLRVSDAGRYTCQASLSSPALGTPLIQSTATDLTLQIPAPTVTLASASTGSAIAGGSETLTCSIQLNDLVDSPVTVTSVWRKDGVDVVSTGRITVSAAQQLTSSLYRATLTISDLSQSTDAGVYSCEAAIAANPASAYIISTSAATSFTLTIEAPTPTVSVSPASSTILDTSPYNTVSLQCTATVEDGVLATKTFQWNRRMLGTTTTSVLTSDGTTSISNSNINSPESTSTLTTPEDSPGTYTYTCTATVLNVVSSASVNVVVQGPSLPVKPESISATVSSFTTTLIQWNIPHVAYTPEQYTVEYGTNSATLTQTSGVVVGTADIAALDQQYSVEITGLQEGLIYYYRVVASNTHGSTFSDVNTITIEDIPVIVSVSSLSSAVVGESFTLNCTAIEEEDISGVPVLTWLGPNGTTLQTAGDFAIGTALTVGTTTSSSLQINPLRVLHSGTYTCQASISEVGFMDSAVYQLTVTGGSVSVSISSTSSEYLAASPVTLTCEVTSGAIGIVTYLWSSTCSGACFINGQTSATVTTSALKSADSGTHTCTVTDSVGSTADADIEITVTGAGLYSSRDGLVTNNSLLIASSNGSIGTLECISGSPTPSSGQWIKPNGQDIIESNDDSFVVIVGGGDNPGHIEVSVSVGHSITSSDQGVYGCVIPDELGVENIIHVGIYPYGFSSPPSITSLEHDSSAGSTFALTCTSTGSVATSVTWSKDGTTVSNGGTFSTKQVLTDGTTSMYDNILMINAEPKDLDGTYICTVANAVSTVEDSITVSGLQVSGNSIFMLGVSETLTCSTDLDGTTTEWLYDGEVVVSVSDPEAQLVFSQINDSIHNRNYICRTITPYGNQQQTVTTLVQVIPADIDVTISTESATSHGGQEFTLTCTVTTVEGLLYQPQVHWLDSAQRPITTEGDITVGSPVISGLTTTITLQFSPLRLSHEEDITCQANIASVAPPYNFSRQAEWELTVAIPPFEVQVEPKTIEGLASQAITLSCIATAHDSVLVHKSFHWSQRVIGEMPTALTDNGDTVTITQANLDAPTSTSQLTIVEGTPGRYQFTCNATLQFSGEVDDISLTDYANVTIAGAEIPTEPTGIAISEVSFESVRVTWTTTSITYSSEDHVVLFSTDPLNLAQQSIGVPVTESGQYSVLQAGLIPGTTYYFRVVASNIFGSTESEQGTFTTLLKDGAPSGAPESFIIQTTGPTSLTFSWAPPPLTQQNGDILSYIISCSPSHISLMYHNAGTQTVSGFTPATTYTCTVHSSNANGNGPAASATATTDDGVPSAVASISYISVSDYKVQLMWVEPATPNGTIVSYHIVVTLYEPTEEDDTLVYISDEDELSEVINLEPYVPYKISIAAKNSNPILGEGKDIIAFSLEGEPSIAPRNLQTTRLNGTHMNISYTPLTLVEARGFIVHYIVKYEPKLGTKRRKRQAASVLVAPEQSYMIIGGLDPDLQYSISVSAATVAGEGPTVNTVVEVPCRRAIQLLLSTVDDCNKWRFIDTDDKLDVIPGVILSAVSEHCDCSLAQTYITNGVFDCLKGDSTQAVLYRATMTASTDSECTMLISYLEDWISSGKASIVIKGNRLTVDSGCMVEIESLTSDVECTTTEESRDPEGGDTTAVIAGAAAGVIVLLIVVALATVIFVQWKRRGGRYKLERRANTPQLDANNAYGHGYVNGQENIELRPIGPRPQRDPQPWIQNGLYGEQNGYVPMHRAVYENPGTNEKDGDHIYDTIPERNEQKHQDSDLGSSLRRTHDYVNFNT